MNCPYDEFKIDESSGITYKNPAYVYWMEGFDARAEDEIRREEAREIRLMELYGDEP